MEKSVKKALKEYKAELPTGYQPTADMGGKVALKLLTSGGGSKKHIEAELLARKIPTEQDDFIEKHGENADLKEVNFSAMKRAIRLHEAEQEWKKNKFTTLDEAYAKCSSIVPYSALCKSVLADQTRVAESILQSADEA